MIKEGNADRNCPKCARRYLHRGTVVEVLDTPNNDLTKEEKKKRYTTMDGESFDHWKDALVHVAAPNTITMYDLIEEEKKMQIFLTAVVECDEKGNIVKGEISGEEANSWSLIVRVVIARNVEEAKIIVARSLTDVESSLKHIKIIAMPMKD
jgi:hypothetical protein